MNFFEKINAKHIPSVDLVKFIMAIFVVAIHTHPYTCIENTNLSFLVSKLISLAVPFFFVASGFFLWRKIDNAIYADKLQILKRWILRLVKLYVIWTFIYLPFTIYGYVVDGLSPLKALLVFVRNFLFVGENMYSWPLWYLLAMITAGVIMYFMVYWRFKKNYIYAFALLALMLGIIIDNAKGTSDLILLYFKLFHTTRNGLFVGLPYLIIGAIIALNGTITKRSVLIPLLIIGFLLHCCGIVIASYIVAYLLFSLVVCLKIDGNPELFVYFRLSSTVIYFSHMLFVAACTILNLLNSPIELFVVTMILSLLLSLFVVKNWDNKVIRSIF